MAKKVNFPTVLTILRMILVVPFLVFLFLGSQANVCGSACPKNAETLLACPDICVNEQIPFYIIALIIFVIAAVTDKIDGDYARKHNQVTDLGKFLDPLADKMLVNTAFLMLTVIGAVPVWIFAIILWRDLAVNGIRMTLAQKGAALAASIWGKIKTTAQMIAIVVIMLNLIIQNEILGIIGLILLCVTVILTIISGCEIIVKGYKNLNRN